MLLNVRINTKSEAKIEEFEEDLKSKKVNYRRTLTTYYPTFVLWVNGQTVKLPYNSYIRQASLSEW